MIWKRHIGWEKGSRADARDRREGASAPAMWDDPDDSFEDETASASTREEPDALADPTSTAAALANSDPSGTDWIALADELGVPYLDPAGYTVESQLLEIIPAELAWRYRVVPLFALEDSLTIVTSDPRDINTLDEIRRVTNHEIECVLAPPQSIETALRRLYGEDRSQLMAELKKLGPSRGEESDRKDPTVTSSEDSGDLNDAPVVRMTQLLLTQAVRQGASDIHIEPARDELVVRLRIDGRMHQVPAPPKHIHAPLVSRLKVMAHMDIAEKRRPQDGRIGMRIDDRDVDFRVSSLPTSYGEHLVLRVLDRSSSLMSLDELGFSPEVVQGVRDILGKSFGILLVTGPTGSGKTTSLYAALADVNSTELNTVTLEDPVEREMRMVRQCQIDQRVGLTFASGLRSILRQDPDIILVGEIRDLETARIAMQAALTGHLVLSSLHTNDAPSAATRLIDMGVEPFLVASAVVGVVGQRLVRRLCPNCRRQIEKAGDQMRRILGDEVADGPFFEASGCDSCRGWGFAGRTVLGELMVMDEGMAELTVDRAPASTLRENALAAGMTSMRTDGLAKARAGITSLEEVARATQV